MIYMFQFDCFGFGIETIYLVKRSLSGLEFSIFLAIAVLLIPTLLWYRNKISSGESSLLNDFSEQPLYQSKDLLLQERSINSVPEYIPVNTSVSVFTKIVLAILAIAVFVTPLYELLNVEYFT